MLIPSPSTIDFINTQYGDGNNMASLLSLVGLGIELFTQGSITMSACH